MIGEKLILLIFDIAIILGVLKAIFIISGKKVMYCQKYIQAINNIFIWTIIVFPQIDFYQKDFINSSQFYGFLAMYTVIMIPLFIWAYKRHKYRFYILNVESEDVENIIEKYLDKEDIKYEKRPEEIYLNEYNKYIYIRGTLDIYLICKEIKELYFYEELIRYIKDNLKYTKKKNISLSLLVEVILVIAACFIRFKILA